jgi:F420-dependent oxidoreductase-like protein
MGFRISTTIDWHGPLDRKRLFEDARAADEGGVHSVWVTEAWGYDAFTLMTLLAEWTERIQIGSGIVNVYSRSPGALAQHFATLDALSEGRIIIGLGTSGSNVIEQFHGVPFDRPLRRLLEYVEIINEFISGRPLNYSGGIFKLQRGFKLRFDPVRSQIPIFIAALSPASVNQTAEIAQGWLPVWVPMSDLPGVVARFREAVARAGRSPAGVTVRSPGTVIITSEVENVRAEARAAFAFYVARMGDVYYQHFSRLGHEDVANAVRQAWSEGGSKAGAAAVPQDLADEMTLVTNSIEQARERLTFQQAAGVDIHAVEVHAESARERQRIYEALAA